MNTDYCKFEITNTTPRPLLKGLKSSRNEGMSTASQVQDRERIWPSRAILTFCRILTKCEPPVVIPGQKLPSAFRIIPHWKSNELLPVGISFDR